MASIHPQSSSMAGPGRLAAVPEGSTDGAKAGHPPVGLYRDRIQTVAVSGVLRRSTIFDHGGSSYSSASNSCPSSNNSGYSSGSASAVELEFSNLMLMIIARQMVSDGYAQRMVEAFVRASPGPALKFGGSSEHALKNWFSELGVDWVLQIDDEQGLRRLLRDKPATTRDLVDEWIRAFTVIVASITELRSAFQTPAVALFGKASITKMLGVVDVIITVLEAEKLQAVLDMFACVYGASLMFTPVDISGEAQSIFNEIGGLLETQGDRLSEIIASTMEEARTLVEADDSWAIEISRGGGEVHNNTRFIMDCIVSIMNAQTSLQHSAPSYRIKSLYGLIQCTVDYLTRLLFTKSESCSDPSLRYLFLLNNSYFVAHVVPDSSGSFNPDLWHLGFKLTPECKKYMDSYLDVSWGHVLSFIPPIPRSSFPGSRLWSNSSSLVKFESAFHKTYQAQKLWKVPDPKIRDALRRAITERVISGYRNYLEEHPELEKHVGRESSSPEVLVEMLGELFEG